MALALQERFETWRRARAGRQSLAAEPGAALFAGVRLRLTLWYIGVLAVVLLVAGTVLYLGVRRALLHNVDQTLAATARLTTEPRPGSGQQGGQPGGPPGGTNGCPFRGPTPPGARPIAIACYGQDGTLIAESDAAVTIPNFTSGSLISDAMHNGRVFDTIDGGDGTGPIRRYAVALRRPEGASGVGVITFGASIQSEMDTLRTLLIALLITGILALIIAALGGLFLAGRALVPIRL